MQVVTSNMYQHLFVLSVLPTIIYSINDDYNVIDLSDILNVDYMPGSLLILENPEESVFENRTTTDSKPSHQGTFHDAFTTMNYHRKMMNEYLCRSYVSEQIISEMKTSRIRRRLGNPIENINSKVGSPFSTSNISIKNSLIDDEGSVNYQEWLKKSATLEDIYRHYDAQNTDTLNQREDGDDNEEYDSHVTGYAFQQPHNQGMPAKFGHSGVGGGYPSYNYGGGHGHSPSGSGGIFGVNSGGHSAYGGGGSIFGVGDHIYSEGTSGHGGHGHTSYHEHSPKHHGGHDKDKLADLFDIALTALAYLSFGMFIVQVIMCISMGTTTTTAMTVMPLSMAADLGGINRGDIMGGGSGGGTGSSSEENPSETIRKGGSVTIIGEDVDEEEQVENEEREEFGEGYIRIGRGVGSGDDSYVQIEPSSKGSKGGNGIY
ncbi:hypothetical protein FQR65_LT08524 [Abscondita terminalis]|nr:hypothetical protein FQR65_LT08524 [Abscondita terminalis]